jgi:3-(3-hydroxy-phenyl)propionate hydroxylase
MINTGRLSTATVHDSPLSTPDETPFAGSAQLGAPVPDAPMRGRDGGDGFLLERLGGRFDLLHVPNGARPNAPDGVRLHVIGDDWTDHKGQFKQRFDATPGATYLLRPDQHLCARWRAFDRGKMARAVDRAMGR